MGLMEDRRVREQEATAMRDRAGEKNAELTQRLHDTQDVLYDSTRGFLELKYEHRKRERQWMEEKELLLQRIDELKADVDYVAAATLRPRVVDDEAASAAPVAPRTANVGVSAYTGDGEGLEAAVAAAAAADMGPSTEGRGANVAMSDRKPGAATVQASPRVSVRQSARWARRAPRAPRGRAQVQESLADMYREQCIELEDEVCRLREERDAAKQMFGDRSRKLLKRLALMNARYEALERRRQLEIEGYQNDTRMLRTRLKDLEKQLYKARRAGSRSARSCECGALAHACPCARRSP